MKPVVLWLDDIRDPFAPNFQEKVVGAIGVIEAEIIWVKSYDEYVQWIHQNDLPDWVCFDHDLGDNVPSGKDAANFLVDYCLDFDKKLPMFASQSDNPAGQKNILSLLENFRKFQG